ncbi:unnamed protein product [Amoebophrya sp. A25]|nr:unnamed protein product [Amoebophrya sp. A25]|eukprot:GSA25T00021398001.1
MIVRHDSGAGRVLAGPSGIMITQETDLTDEHKPLSLGRGLLALRKPMGGVGWVAVSSGAIVVRRQSRSRVSFYYVTLPRLFIFIMMPPHDTYNGRRRRHALERKRET